MLHKKSMGDHNHFYRVFKVTVPSICVQGRSILFFVDNSAAYQEDIACVQNVIFVRYQPDFSVIPFTRPGYG
jgi:hypothetical protein